MDLTLNGLATKCKGMNDDQICLQIEKDIKWISSLKPKVMKMANVSDYDVDNYKNICLNIQFHYCDGRTINENQINEFKRLLNIINNSVS